MIASVLIANRGEIARRITRTARRMGIRVIAVFSDADAGGAHVREADVAVRIGPAPVRESYLDQDKILSAARATGADAIHPGYGFLSENAEFAQAVIEAGVTWVGPPPAAIRAMGRKDAAKKLMREAGVPVTPGYLGDDQNPDRLMTEAEAIGWPVLIKAVAGGGGKGMRKVERASDFHEALSSAAREAASAFGDKRVLLEKYVTRPRHIEVQVFADSQGGIVHLFERDCSVQRRHQKLIEEAPAPGLEQSTRDSLCDFAVRAARAVGYQGAGTVEFIADASTGLHPDRIWFMEMNTRLQVEHPVTEAVTGQDLVEWQFRIASGERLPLAQDQIKLNGHAIEARLYAEDPATGFLPSVGALAEFHMPNDVRVDASADAGDVVTTHYDPLLAKLISHAPTRGEAAGALARSCSDVRVWPVRTNAWFLARCLTDAEFMAGGVDTGFVEGNFADLTLQPKPSADLIAAAVSGFASGARLAGNCPAEPWSGSLLCFRLNSPSRSVTRLYEQGAAFDAELSPGGGATMSVGIGDKSVLTEQVARREIAAGGRVFHLLDAGGGGKVVFEGGTAFAFRTFEAGVADALGLGDGTVRAPMPGRIVSIAKSVGAQIAAGETLMTLEAMKMEHALKAPCEGVVVELAFKEGDQVTENSVLARIESSG